MTADQARTKENFRVLTTEAFDFVLHNELKRAVRSQNFLTLVHLQPTVRGVPGGSGAEPDVTIEEIARLISRDVRETDLLAHTQTGRLSIVFLDADLPSSLAVIERLMSRLEHYEFSQPLVFDIGAACCPTHGADVDALRRAAESRPVHPRRSNASNA